MNNDKTKSIFSITICFPLIVPQILFLFPDHSLPLLPTAYPSLHLLNVKY